MKCEGHTEITYHYLDDDNSTSKLINNSKFEDLCELDNEIIELEQAKSKIRLNVPLIVGMFVLDYSKLLMLRFLYDYLLHHIPQTNFCLIQTDTDSLYMSFSEPSLYLAIPKNKRKSFMENYSKWFAVEYCPDHQREFFDAAFANGTFHPCDKCKEWTLYDGKTAGKMHIEWMGSGVVALCSKSYYCFDHNEKNTKISAKGISKKHNDLKVADYKDVLTNQKISTANNRGFRIKGDDMFTYNQTKKGLNYFYAKRIVLSDHITTLPTHL